MLENRFIVLYWSGKLRIRISSEYMWLRNT